MDDELCEIELWNRSDARDGRPPGWYFLIERARYLGVAPWELEQHPEWVERAKVAELGELRAERAKRGSNIIPPPGPEAYRA